MHDLWIGCHLSSSKGFLAMGREALGIGANTFAFFTRNPRGGKAKEMDPADAASLLDLMAEHSFGILVAHAPYTLNCCAAENHVREFAHLCMQEDLARMEYMPGQYYNFHPGSHVGQGTEKGIEKTAEILNSILTDSQTTTVLIETMAGQGSEIGSTFEQIRELIDRVACREKIGVCLDTCHVFAAGYDIRDADTVLTEFDSKVGLSRLRAVHVNDSMQPLGSHRDRHARIGEGEIGLEAVRRFVHHPVIRELPLILETPNELEGYAEEIRILKG